MSRYKRIFLLNRNYRIKKFYDFLNDTAIKGGLVINFFVALLLILEYFFFDLNSLIYILVESFSSTTIFVVFLISETVLGLIPPAIFINWSSESFTPWLFLFIIASLSYVGLEVLLLIL
jgi:hypothetical protein